MASNGSPERRAAEAREAARILGVAGRETIGLADRNLAPTPERVRTVAEAVRRWRPAVVLLPYGLDRHPDHEAASRLVREAVFDAGLARYNASGEPHRVRSLVSYFVNAHPEPAFVVDVTEVYGVKKAALAAYVSQFEPVAGSAGRPTPLNQGYLGWVELRDTWYGSLAGVERAEGFAWEGTPRVPDLVRDLGVTR